MAESIKGRGVWNEVLKGSLVATLLSVLFVLAVALIARIFSLSANIIPIANLVIKIASVFVAVLIAIKTAQAGFVKGALIGGGFILLSSLVFWMLGGQFDLLSLIKDMAIVCVTGAVAGIIAVNRKK